MSSLLKDLRYAARLLRRSPGFTLVALLSLALGIGGNTAIFSIVNAVLLRPMPVRDAASLVSVFETDERNPGNLPISDLNFQDLRAQNTVFTGMSAISFGQVNFAAATGDARPIPVQLVTGNYFDLLGVQMTLGRGFAADEDTGLGAHPVAVVSWPFWQTQLGGGPGVIGRQIVLNRQPFTVIGVAPRTFTGTFALGAPSAWVPMTMHRQVQPELTWYETRRGLFLFPFGRLKPGVTVAQARSNLQAIMANLAREFPVDNQGRSADVLPVLESRINPDGQGQVLVLARLLQGLMGIVLLIACANLANLLLARASRRRRELAVRLAIGADRWRLVRQLLTESVLLALAGGALGLLMAVWMLRGLTALNGVLPLPLTDDLALDPRVLAFTLGVSALTGVLFGLVPAIEASRTDLAGTIKQESLALGEGRGLLRKSLVGAQVALSVVSLVAAGLFVRSLAQTVRIQPGFDTTNVAAVAVDLGREGYTPERGLVFYHDLAARARAMPGVEAASVAQAIPLGGATFLRSVFLDQQDTTGRDRRLVPVNYITPGFFHTTGIALVRGRDFTDHDVADSPPVAIVNEAMAREFWPDTNPVGQRFRFFGDDAATEVIAVVRDSKINNLAEQPAPFIYEPLYQSYQTAASLLVRVHGSAAALGPNLRQLVAGLDPRMTVLDVRTLDQQVADSTTGQQTLAILLGIFGAVALLLASMGLYGVASYWVGMRGREIGVRMALGARPGGVLMLVLRRSLVVMGVGLLVGVGIALAAAALLGSELATLLVRVPPADPITLGGTVLVLFLVGLAACAVPARRAARIDPLLALRQD